MSALSEEPISFDSDGLRLGGRLHEGQGGLAAVILHPHPQYGGDMDNHVVTAIADVLAERGATTLRFNFRGVGQSQGQYDHGRGEALDAVAAVRTVRTGDPAAKLLLAGYSFGAMIAAQVAAEVRPHALVLVSPPLAPGGLAPLESSLPVLLAAGDRDQVSPAAGVLALQTEAVTVAIAPGVDHSWWPGVEFLADALRSFLVATFAPVSGA